MTHARATHRRWGLIGAGLILSAAPAWATTPTPTPTAVPEIHANPNPARSGQTVYLRAEHVLSEPSWRQLSGPPVTLENSDSTEASFVAPAVAASTLLQFRFGEPPQLDSRDVDVTVLPADAVLVHLGDGSGPAGGVAEVAVAIDPLGRAVATLRNRLTFPSYLRVVASQDGTPDCEPDGGASGTFSFVPASCADDDSCRDVEAELTFDAPITAPASAYRCRVALTAELVDHCTHTVSCGSSSATSDAHEALQVLCTDGAVTITQPDAEPRFALDVEPAEPQVGDTVRLVWSVYLNGGLAHYFLSASDSFFDGTTSDPDVGNPGLVIYTLTAKRAGNALLQLGVNYETMGGCPGNNVYYFTYAASPSTPLTIRDAGGVRLSGRVAEFPGCQGAMRDVTVVLQPGDRVVQTDLSDGSFAFDGVSPGEYALIVSQGCNAYGCWPTRAVRVGSDDLSVTLCPQTSACVGDCNGDRRVTVDELVAGVAVALGSSLAPPCAALDSDSNGLVKIEELITAVNAALEGCSGVNNTTPTPTPTPPSP